MRCLGMEIRAVNQSGSTQEPVAFIGTTAELEEVLRPADVVVVALALTNRTAGLLGARELSWMKETAVLVNISRGEIIDEGALYRHLKAHPDFTACIEAWWIEPVRHGEFRTNYPFFELPNLIAAPHNSASVPRAYLEAFRRGARNVRAALSSGEVRFLVTEDQRLR
jgi:phosphoglycerate dehydrogenase-like enzyme